MSGGRVLRAAKGVGWDWEMPTQGISQFYGLGDGKVEFHMTPDHILEYAGTTTNRIERTLNKGGLGPAYDAYDYVKRGYWWASGPNGKRIFKFTANQGAMRNYTPVPLLNKRIFWAAYTETGSLGNMWAGGFIMRWHYQTQTIAPIGPHAIYLPNSSIPRIGWNLFELEITPLAMRSSVNYNTGPWQSYSYAQWQNVLFYETYGASSQAGRGVTLDMGDVIVLDTSAQGDYSLQIDAIRKEYQPLMAA